MSRLLAAYEYDQRQQIERDRRCPRAAALRASVASLLGDGLRNWNEEIELLGVSMALDDCAKRNEEPDADSEVYLRLRLLEMAGAPMASCDACNRSVPAGHLKSQMAGGSEACLCPPCRGIDLDDYARELAAFGPDGVAAPDAAQGGKKGMQVIFVYKGNGPERLLCEAEIVFDEDGPLAGMKLVGFSVWRGQEGDAFITFPARSFGAGGERRFFDLLRAVEPGATDPKRVKDWILDEWRKARG